EEGPDNSLLIGTNNKGLLTYKDGVVNQVSISNTVDYSVNVIKYTPGDGRIYVGTTEGLYIMQNGESSAVDFLNNIQVNHILIDNYESVWVATERGLARINEKHGTKEFLRSGKSFSGAHLTSLFLDKEGSLWMSTGKSGLLRLKESMVRNYNEVHGLSVDRVNVVTEATDGKFYVCLDDGFINIIDNGKISEMKIDQPGWNESVRDILVEENGTYWIASYNGLIRKDKHGEKLYTTENGLPSNSVRRIFKDREGRIWLATRTGGVVQITKDKVARVYNRTNGLSSDYILAIEQDAAGRLLIGTHSGGLNVIYPDGTTSVHHIQADDDGVLIFNVHVDEEGHLWLATSVGLYHFDFTSKKFTRLAITDVVKGESYFDWVEDHQGGIWIPTNIGIVELSKAEVRSFLAGKIPSIKSKIYNNFDGMKNKECTGATRSTLSSKGEIWVPTIEGIAIVNPRRKSVNMIVPPVYITQVITDKQTIQNPTKPIAVEPGNFRVTIKFTSLSLLAPNKVKFRYMIEGVDQDWIDAETNTRTVHYTNLSPGNYVFTVIASNNDGIWNEKGVQLPLEVRPHYYQTAWFYFLLAAMTVIAFYGIYKWRVNAVEHKNSELIKVNSELDRFVYSASHDLRAPLASILGLVKLARLDNDPENKLQYLDKVETSIHKLDGFIHDIINYSRNARTELESRACAFEKEINEILDGLKYQEKSDKIRKEINVQGAGVFYTDTKRLNIILYNLITNAIKYHNINQADPFIRVDVDFTAKEALIRIADNGIGIGEHHLQNVFKMFYRADERSSGSGLGLFIAKETVEKLRGTLRVQSKVREGSVFEVKLPSLTTSSQLAREAVANGAGN
ncbi:MAG TPA: ATP-binding protein, partial [Chryseosolibacter sp.]|nr:ATP-binding protein [Chryseosolibacter sp.]